MELAATGSPSLRRLGLKRCGRAAGLDGLIICVQTLSMAASRSKKITSFGLIKLQKTLVLYLFSSLQYLFNMNAHVYDLTCS
ncbi:hypothetical protein LINPERPRIM_LOCUS14593 [Linum perenne]